ncbi:hypothetical protein BC831DRAFT_462006 [Entophlyctis helioformis]|nr:hypothetical protein BC831DRAFT_462006 [Entophlyctis helioformis]
MDHAAENGHLHVVKWLHANRTEGCTTNAMDWAARSGHLHVVKWLLAHRTEGFTYEALIESKTDNIATTLIKSLTLEQRASMADAITRYRVGYNQMRIPRILALLEQPSA